MLERVGDALNWLAAGVLFPITVLPLAYLLSGRSRLRGAVAHAASVAAIAFAGLLFFWLTPRLAWLPSASTASIFAALATLTIAAAAAREGTASAGERIARLAGAIAKRTSKAVMVLLLIMALTQFAIVLLRYVFSINSIFMQQSITYMHAAAFMLAVGYAAMTDDHVRVDVFYRGLSEKRRALIDLIGAYVLVFPFCFLILWASSRYVAASWAVREGSTEQSGIQGVFLLKTLIPLFALMLGSGAYWVAWRAARRLRGDAPEDAL